MTSLSPAPRARRPHPHENRSGPPDASPERASGGHGNRPAPGAARATSPLVRTPAPAPEGDRVLRLLAADAYELHRLVYEAFAREGERRFLFAPIEIRGRVHRVLVRRFDAAARFVDGQRFDLTLRALPTVKNAGRRQSIGAAPDKDPLRLRWIEARARAHGFELLDGPELRVERVRVTRPERPFHFNACLYRVPIVVVEPARFARAYTRGLGQGRAWGCGMMILNETATP